MKKWIWVILILALLLTASACGNGTEPAESEQEAGTTKTTEENTMGENRIYIEIGEHALTAALENNESAEALKELLANGPLTIPAENYGGFEKVCALGTSLPRNDRQMTTQAGDICLYSGDQIVIFYGSNSWAYTKLGRILDADESELKEALSGGEGEILVSLEPTDPHHAQD